MAAPVIDFAVNNPLMRLAQGAIRLHNDAAGNPTAAPVPGVDGGAIADGSVAAPVASGLPAPGAEQIDFSMWGMFWHADTVVKIVMIMLFVASIWAWAIIFEKWLTIRRLKARADAFEAEFWAGGSLEALADKVAREENDPMTATFTAAMREWRRSVEKGIAGGKGSLQARIERVMSVAIGREMARLERNMTFLATLASTAPFIGLFGTVWGIMHTFTGIAAAKNTSLAVVAPGIAEALFATALGLVAAIPASAAYNKFATEFGRYGERLENFTGEFTAILSRHLEERP